MSGFTCRGCEDRTPNCHSTCEKYIREKNEYEKLKSEIYSKNSDFESYRSDSILRNRNISATKRRGWNWHRK